MNLSSHIVRFAAACLLLMLAACGGGGDDGAGAGTPAASTVVGAAGGTVSGPNGAKVVIPPGALATGTTIAITQTSAGAPPLPAGFSVSGQMFAFTPHGTTFALPVTITLPFDPALVPAGSRPTLFKTNTQNQWQQVADVTVDGDTVRAQVTGFSFGTAGVERLPPQREWEFVVDGAIGDPLKFNDFDRPAWEKVEARAEFGTEAFDLDVEDDDQKITLEVFSSANGVTFWASAEDVGDASLSQTQGFIKRAENAALQFVITGATLQAVDFNQFPSPEECPRGLRLLECHPLSAVISFLAQAFDGESRLLRGANGAPLLDTAGRATLEGRTGLWAFDARPNPDFTSAWSELNFLVTTDALGNPKAKLVGEIVIDVDLSSITVGTKFYVNSRVFASAVNKRGKESAIAAYVRDPARTGGSRVNTAGLELTNDTAFPPPPPGLTAPLACPSGPNPAAGVLQFSAATYEMLEDRFAGQRGILVTRTQGSTGRVSATFTTAGGGTAVPGVHYKPKSITVTFADGDTASRIVALDILVNSNNEPDRTVNLLLSDPGGCATLGAQASAVLTILDDDRPPTLLPSFTIGGTVAGLAGTGLVLRHVSTGENLAAGNGPFTFLQLLPSGFEYSVTVGTQPGNPSQVCTVTNGSGVANANVSNVAVNCITPTANGALDLGFGDAGKVSTAFGGDDTAMALQADGKIVMAGGSGTDFLLARYNPDGSLDTSFGAAGLVTSDVGSGSADEARGVAMQSDGKIVVVGNAVVGRTANNQTNFDFALARYNADGSLDTSFGSGGKVTTDFNGQVDRALAVAIQSDGKIVVAGSAGIASGIGVDFGIARYHSDGTLDASFGSGGKVTTDIASGTDIAQNVVLQANGAILVSGVLTIGNSSDLANTGLARYNPNGSLDTTFATAGKLTLPNLRLDEAMTLQGDGKIVIAGSVVVAASRQFGVMRLDSNGSPDSGFGAGGLATTAFSTQDDFGRAVAVQADGRIVVAGQSSNRSNPDFAVARFAANGTLDPSFGTAGKLTIDFFGSFDGAENVVMQPDGRIVIGGFARNGTRTGYGLARVNP